jgi:hypothetical protein
MTSGESLGTFCQKYYDVFAQSKNCGARQTVLASERLGNNIYLEATATKQMTEQSLLIGSRFLTMQQLDNNRGAVFSVILAEKL